MNWIKSAIKIVCINILILIVLLGFIAIAPPLISDVNYLRLSLFKSKTSVYDKALLPNYVGYEWANDYFSEEENIKTNYHDFIGWRRKEHSSSYINIDKQGFRKNSINSEILYSDAKVWFFGGSTIWGTGSKDDLTIPAFYQKISGLPTFNFGEGAYISHQSLNLLIKAYASQDNLNKRLIIFYDGVNDVVHKCRSDQTYFSTQQEPVFAKQYNSEPEKSSKSLLAFTPTIEIFTKIFSKIKFGSSEKNNPASVATYNCDTDSAKADQIIRTLILDWRLAKSIAESKGGQFLPILQPVSYIGTPNLKYLPEVSGDVSLRRQYEIIYSKLKKKLAVEKIEYLDLTEIFDGSDLFYIDFCHVTPNGNRLVAQKINNYVLKNLSHN